MKRFATVLLMLMVAGAAEGQVFRCQDERGRLVLSDRACEGGSQIMRAPTAQERFRSEQQNAIANQRIQTLEQAEAARKAAQQGAPQRVAEPSGMASRECAQARDRLNLVAGLLNKKERDARLPSAEAEAAGACGYEAPLRPPPRSRPDKAFEGSAGPDILVNCDQGGCWGTSGQRYNRAAGGFFRSDGRFCPSSGGPMMTCN